MKKILSIYLIYIEYLLLYEQKKIDFRNPTVQQSQKTRKQSKQIKMSEAAAVAQNTNTTQRQSAGTSTGRGRGGPRNQRQTVVASASVPVTTELIGAVVGKQGATINKIKDATRTRISHLEPNPGDGHLFHSFHISGTPQGVDRARRWILNILGNTYRADHPEDFKEDEASAEPVREVSGAN